MKTNSKSFIVLFIIIIIIIDAIFITVLYHKNQIRQLGGQVPVKVIYQNIGGTYNLIIEGTQFGWKVFPEKIYVEKINEKILSLYKSIDHSSLEESAPNFSNSWSPKGDLLILPRGRFYGFTVFTMENLPKSLANGKGKWSILIEDSTGTKLWHEFDQWINDTTVRFIVELSNDHFTFEWNIKEEKVKSLDRNIGEFCIKLM